MCNVYDNVMCMGGLNCILCGLHYISIPSTRYLLHLRRHTFWFLIFPCSVGSTEYGCLMRHENTVSTQAVFHQLWIKDITDVPIFKVCIGMLITFAKLLYVNFHENTKKIQQRVIKLMYVYLYHSIIDPVPFTNIAASSKRNFSRGPLPYEKMLCLAIVWRLILYYVTQICNCYHAQATWQSWHRNYF